MTTPTVTIGAGLAMTMEEKEELSSTNLERLGVRASPRPDHRVFNEDKIQLTNALESEDLLNSTTVVVGCHLLWIRN